MLDYKNMSRAQVLSAIAVEEFYANFQDLLVLSATLLQSLTHLRALRDVSKSLSASYLDMTTQDIRQSLMEKQSLRKICYKQLPVDMATFVSRRAEFEKVVEQSLAKYDQEGECPTPFPADFIWTQVQPDSVSIIQDIVAEAPPALLKNLKMQLSEKGVKCEVIAPFLDAATRSVAVAPTEELLKSLAVCNEKLAKSVSRSKGLNGSMTGSIRVSGLVGKGQGKV
ncbi:hypothetical protein SS50377_22972 [Spironucleus salmonicida]|uniref:Uncharacterized protein n=1 Tax=Spironucleus salmonicida TaxID=348837 RepID=V6LTL0_9EUKA|nr:hypothetical protein SS50377_22972 [Spironucleus salmonicida]|eukprot:EST47982.1 hypothetical protein SS50377_11896 [Spironucleus salmonicida]